MKSQFRHLAVLASLSLLPILARAAEGKSLETLVIEATAANPEIRYYEAQIDAAKAVRAGATLKAPPEFNFELGGKSTRDTAGISGEGVAWSVSAMQTFEWPGRIALRKAIAGYDVTLAEIGLAQFRRELAGRVRLGAWRLASANQRQAAAKLVQERFSELRQVLVQRDPAGVAPALELRVIDATELILRKRVTDASVTVKSARATLNVLRARPVDEPLSVESARLELNSLPAHAALLDMAFTNSFTLRSRAAELEQQGFRVELARHEKRPAVSVGPVYSEEHSLGSDRIFGIGVSFPWPLKRQNKVNVQAAESRRIQAEALLASASRDLESAIIEQAVTYEVVLEELNHWKPDTISEFARAAELADRHYRLGAVPVTTYVEMQQQYLEAVDSLLDLQQQALEAAGKIETLTGTDASFIKLIPASGK